MLILIIPILLFCFLTVGFSLTSLEKANRILFITMIITLFIPFTDLIDNNKAFLTGSIIFVYCFTIFALKNIRTKKLYDKTFKIFLILFLIYFLALCISLVRFSQRDIFYIFYYYLIFLQSGITYFIFYNLYNSGDKYDILATLICVLGSIFGLYLFYEFFLISADKNLIQRAFMDQHNLALSSWDAYQRSLSSNRLSGGVLSWLGGTNGRSFFLLMMYSYILPYKFFHSTKYKRILKYSSIAIIVVAIILQVSRSVYGFFILINLIYGYFKIKNIKNFTYNFLFFSAFILVFYFSISEVDIVASKIFGRSNISESGRFILASEGLRYASENFFIGKGLDSVVLDRNYLRNNFNLLGRGNTHNQFVTILIDTGIIGLICFILLLESIYSKSKIYSRYSKLDKYYESQALCGKLLLSSIFLISFVAHNLFISPIFTLFSILIASTNKYNDSFYHYIKNKMV